MLRRTEGIVLRSLPYGEADLIVTYLTRDLGLARAFAKSPRKIKSRFGSSLEPLTHSKISLWGREDAALPRLTQSDIINSFQALREDYDCFLRLSGMLELSLNMLAEGEENRKAFDLLKGVMEQMQGDCSPIHAVYYRVRLLELAGLSPNLKGCTRCGRVAIKVMDPPLKFYMSQGSMICADCAVKLKGSWTPSYESRIPFENILRLTPSCISLYETLKSWDVQKISRVKATAGLLRELSSMLDDHIEYRLSRPLRAKVKP